MKRPELAALLEVKGVEAFPIVCYAPLFHHALIRSNHHLQISLSFRELVIRHCRNIQTISELSKDIFPEWGKISLDSHIQLLYGPYLLLDPLQQ